MSTESADERDPDIITDPIGVSLQASIPPEDTAFRELRKPRPDSLFSCRTLDVWAGPNSPPRRLDRTYPLSRDLPDRLFEAYHPSASDHERLVLRLLVTRPVTAKDGLAWHDDLGKTGWKQINYLPFVPEAVDDLIRQWDLPRDWAWLRLHAKEVGNFSRKTEWDFSVTPARAVRIGMGSCFLSLRYLKL